MRATTQRVPQWGRSFYDDGEEPSCNHDGHRETTKSREAPHRLGLGFLGHLFSMTWLRNDMTCELRASERRLHGASRYHFSTGLSSTTRPDTAPLLQAAAGPRLPGGPHSARRCSGSADCRSRRRAPVESGHDGPRTNILCRQSLPIKLTRPQAGTGYSLCRCQLFYQQTKARRIPPDFTRCPLDATKWL